LGDAIIQGSGKSDVSERGGLCTWAWQKGRIPRSIKAFGRGPILGKTWKKRGGGKKRQRKEKFEKGPISEVFEGL